MHWSLPAWLTERDSHLFTAVPNGSIRPVLGSYPQHTHIPTHTLSHARIHTHQAYTLQMARSHLAFFTMFLCEAWKALAGVAGSAGWLMIVDVLGCSQNALVHGAFCEGSEGELGRKPFPRSPKATAFHYTDVNLWLRTMHLQGVWFNTVADKRKKTATHPEHLPTSPSLFNFLKSNLLYS